MPPFSKHKKTKKLRGPNANIQFLTLIKVLSDTKDTDFKENKIRLSCFSIKKQVNHIQIAKAFRFTQKLTLRQCKMGWLQSVVKVTGGNSLDNLCLSHL